MKVYEFDAKIIKHDFINAAYIEFPYDTEKEFFNSLSYTSRKEYINWIISAKKVETRKKRIDEAIIKLSKKEKF